MGNKVEEKKLFIFESNEKRIVSAKVKLNKEFIGNKKKSTRQSDLSYLFKL